MRLAVLFVATLVASGTVACTSVLGKFDVAGTECVPGATAACTLGTLAPACGAAVRKCRADGTYAPCAGVNGGTTNCQSKDDVDCDGVPDAIGDTCTRDAYVCAVGGSDTKKGCDGVTDFVISEQSCDATPGSRQVSHFRVARDNPGLGIDSAAIVQCTLGGRRDVRIGLCGAALFSSFGYVFRAQALTSATSVTLAPLVDTQSGVLKAVLTVNDATSQQCSSSTHTNGYFAVVKAP